MQPPQPVVSHTCVYCCRRFVKSTLAALAAHFLFRPLHGGFRPRNLEHGIVVGVEENLWVWFLQTGATVTAVFTSSAFLFSTAGMARQTNGKDLYADNLMSYQRIILTLFLVKTNTAVTFTC